MTLDEIVQKIYAERYTDPKDPAIATMLRDGMVREIVESALKLATGSLALELVATRREYHAAYKTWMEAAELVRAEKVSVTVQNDAYAKAEICKEAEAAWLVALAKLDAWITCNEPCDAQETP